MHARKKQNGGCPRARWWAALGYIRPSTVEEIEKGLHWGCLGLFLWRLGIGCWGGENQRCGGSCTFYPQGSLSFYSHGAPRETVFPSKHIIPPGFPGMQHQLLGDWGEEGHRAWPGQDLHEAGPSEVSSPQRKGFVMALCLTNRAADSPLPFVIRSCGRPPPRISPSSLLCTHTCSHTALLPLSPKISSHLSLCSLIIPRLNQEEAEGHVLSGNRRLFWKVVCATGIVRLPPSAIKIPNLLLRES